MGGCVRSLSKQYVAFIICIFAVIIGTLLFTTLVMDGYYMLSSLFLLAVIMLPFYIRFERKAFVSREIVLVAVLAAIAAVSRVPFSILPSVQPTSFVIIVSAIVFGSETGFMIGATAAIVSNIFRTRSMDTVANVFVGHDWFYSRFTS